MVLNSAFGGFKCRLYKRNNSLNKLAEASTSLLHPLGRYRCSSVVFARAPSYPTSRAPTSPQRNPLPPPPLPLRPTASEDDVMLPRSLLIDKEVITRTTGRRLGYVHEVYVDPSRLEVVSLYLRMSSNPIGAAIEEIVDHVWLKSLRQVGDVVLVHDESALLDPSANEGDGYYRVIRSEVQTEDGVSLGKVRDFVFNPDDGAISSIKFDALGIPSLPQGLLSCSSLAWQDIVAVGPTRVIVKRGAEYRMVKESEGWLTEYVTPLVDILTSVEDDGSQNYRSDPAYAEWYAQHGTAYEQYHNKAIPKPVYEPPPPPQQQRTSRRQPPPRALPSPQSVPFKEAVRSDPVQQRRQRVPVGGLMGSGQPQYQQQRQMKQMPYQQQQQAYGRSPSSASRPPSSQKSRQEIPQNGIPIIDRTPPPPYRKRDADGNYGERQLPSRKPPPASNPKVIEPDVIMPGDTD